MTLCNIKLLKHFESTGLLFWLPYCTAARRGRCTGDNWDGLTSSTSAISENSWTYLQNWSSKTLGIGSLIVKALLRWVGHVVPMDSLRLWKLAFDQRKKAAQSGTTTIVWRHCWGPAASSVLADNHLQQIAIPGACRA